MQPLDFATVHPSVRISHENDTGHWHPSSGFDELPPAEPAWCFRPEEATAVVNAAWSKLEEVYARYDVCVGRLNADAAGESQSPGNGRADAESDLDIWGDCLSLSGERVYAEIFVDKDMVPVVELVVALIGKDRPTASGLAASREQVISKAKAALLASGAASGEPQHYQH